MDVTEETHPDYINMKEALERVKLVILKINSEKWSTDVDQNMKRILKKQQQSTFVSEKCRSLMRKLSKTAEKASVASYPSMGKLHLTCTVVPVFYRDINFLDSWIHYQVLHTEILGQSDNEFTSPEIIC